MFKIVEVEQVPQLLFSSAFEYLITFNLLYFTRKSTLYAAFKDEAPQSQQLNSKYKMFAYSCRFWIFQ